MTTRTTMTRTIRLAIGTAAVLALMSQAAQARPSGGPGATQRTHIAASSILKNKLQLPATVIKTSVVSPANNVAAAHANDNPTVPVPPARGQVAQQATPTQTGTAKTSATGFDWFAAAVGAASVLALVLIGAAALTKHGRRRVPLSA
jgi:hypothetical protein